MIVDDGKSDDHIDSQCWLNWRMEVDEVVVGGGGGDYSGDQRWSEVVKVVVGNH